MKNSVGRCKRCGLRFDDTCPSSLSATLVCRRNNKPVTPITEAIAVREYTTHVLSSSQLGGNHVVAPQELQGRSQIPRIHCDDRPDQLQRLRLRAALGALPEGYRGRAVPHHLRLRPGDQSAKLLTKDETREGLRRILLNFPTCCARIEWWIGSTLSIGRQALRPSSIGTPIVAILWWFKPLLRWSRSTKERPD